LYENFGEVKLVSLVKDNGPGTAGKRETAAFGRKNRLEYAE
jgi:hypothetical protein